MDNPKIQHLTTLFNPDVEDRASESDRIWFEAHPHLPYRLRPALEYELGLPHGKYVLVRQVAPGFRVRVPITIMGKPPCGNSQIGRLAELVMAGEAAFVFNDRVVSLADLPGVRHE